LSTIQLITGISAEKVGDIRLVSSNIIENTSVGGSINLLPGGGDSGGSISLIAEEGKSSGSLVDIASSFGTSIGSFTTDLHLGEVSLFSGSSLHASARIGFFTEKS